MFIFSPGWFRCVDLGDLRHLPRHLRHPTRRHHPRLWTQARRNHLWIPLHKRPCQQSPGELYYTMWVQRKLQFNCAQLAFWLATTTHLLTARSLFQTEPKLWNFWLSNHAPNNWIKCDQAILRKVLFYWVLPRPLCQILYFFYLQNWVLCQFYLCSRR